MNSLAQHQSLATDYNWPTRRDRELQQEYATYFWKAFRWSFFGTFTFSHDVMSRCANGVLDRGPAVRSPPKQSFF